MNPLKAVHETLLASDLTTRFQLVQRCQEIPFVQEILHPPEPAYEILVQEVVGAARQPVELVEVRGKNRDSASTVRLQLPGILPACPIIRQTEAEDDRQGETEDTGEKDQEPDPRVDRCGQREAKDTERRHREDDMQEEEPAQVPRRQLLRHEIALPG